MADERLRELERRAQAGDAEAAERLYWNSMKILSGPQLMDRLIEGVVRAQTKKAPTVWQKIAFLRGEPLRQQTPEALDQLRRRWATVAAAGDLHRVPREVRQPGFTTYCQQDGGVYRLDHDREWRRICQLSAEPPGHPLHVVQTLAERDALEVGQGEACLVLANRGVYRSSLDTNRFSGSQRVNWHSIRFERGAGA